jgi:DNA end-binding protein Ku
MIRAIWKGVIQFGPVRAAVKLYTAVEDTRVHARLLHDADHQHLEQRMVCSAEDRPVERDEIVKGYPLDAQHYIEIEPDELEALAPSSSREIELIDFVPGGQVDARYVDRTYYLGPDQQEQRYADLAESLRQSRLAGVCRWVMRKKPYLGLLECSGRTMTLTTCRYPDEVVSEEDLSVPETSVGEKERKAALQLIGAMVDDFKPEAYTDEYQDKLKALIEQKARGEEVKPVKLRKIHKTREENLLNTLESSLAALNKKRPSRTKKETAGKQ